VETYTVLHGDAYQVTPAAADGALTCKIRNVSVFGRRGGYLADLSKKKGSGTMAGASKSWPSNQMRTLTAYGIGVVIVLAVLNCMAWRAGTAQLHDLNVLSAGFVLGVLGTYISAWVNGYRRVI